MVARKFQVQHNGSTFDLDYDTDDGFEVLKFQLFSLTSIPPDEQKIIGGDDERTVSDDSDLEMISHKLRLLSIDEVEKEKTEPDFAKSDEELARLLQAEEEALMMQQFVASENKEQVEQRIRPYVDQVLMYEDPHRQEAAQKTVPVDKLEEKALIALARTVENITKEDIYGLRLLKVIQHKDHIHIVPICNHYIQDEEGENTESRGSGSLVCILSDVDRVGGAAQEGNFKPTKIEQDHAFLLQLLFWFKQSFRWVNAPPCDSCNNETVSQGMGIANPSESLYGASRIELYRCKLCSNVTRFPRYNDPMKLLETRKGRCGEWANCFTLYCRAFGYESRLILDFTDHVWTECFSSYLGRWMHLDPCEGIFDNPLLYEKGWNKKLDYVIAIAKDGVYDVTKRYTRKWHDVLSRRVMTTESTLAAIIFNITRECRKSIMPEMLINLDKRDESETEELERSLFSKDDTSISLPGRQSGDREWRISRSEFVSDDQYALSSSCPVRRCVDEHVTKIYNAFFPVVCELVEKSSDKSRAIELLESFKRILVNLKNSPFKTRRTTINAVSNGARSFIEMLPLFAQLLDALSLKRESGVKGITEICLASDPVKTSVALPVVFHALDDLIYNINTCGKLTKESLSWPLLKLNRICSGFVLASGEELPFGIVTSAFDGTRMSKWKEPNGATGCWIIYKLIDNQMHELVAYELMSANDAPEADPMDWVVEGSDDGGSSWHILDKQISQTFDTRFQRKTFEVKSHTLLANAFRFRFLVVRNAKATSQLQIGSIDLYARKSG